MNAGVFELSVELSDAGDVGNSIQESWAIQSDASGLGFDWPDISGVFDKVREETNEIQEAWESGDREHAKRELGDLMFAMVNLARFLDADPREELSRANARFTERFSMLKQIVRERGVDMRKSSLDELDVIWEQVKKTLRERCGHSEENEA
jgi:tetrapyrrole methylase family protein/MazG family protein